MQTYLFYDLETTGLSKSFDQILQFAAIRTDMNLKELERYELNVKLNPDVIPAPRAVITHHIGVKEAMNGIPEIEAIQKIHRWLNQPGTVSLGYNTLGFDDEFLRFSFYRNLLSPYTHQYANRCSRMDIYPMTVMYFLFANHIIQWPKKNDKLSLKLEDLNEVNQFAKGRSHHAMVDVEVTLELARRFFAEKNTWREVQNFFNKELEREHFNNFREQELLMVHGKLGQEKFYQCPVLFLGNHHHYKNQTLWLKLDTDDFSKMTLDNFREMSKVVFKKWGEPSFILPSKDDYIQHLTTERRELARANKNWLEKNPDMMKTIVNHHAEYLHPVCPQTDIDASLYLNGFWNFAEEKFCQRFHAADPQEKAKMLNQVANPKLQTLALRLLGRHYPQALNAEQKAEFEKYLAQTHCQDESLALLDFRGEKRLTKNVALAEINLLRQENIGEMKLQLLKELEDYLANLNCSNN